MIGELLTGLRKLGFHLRDSSPEGLLRSLMDSNGSVGLTDLSLQVTLVQDGLFHHTARLIPFTCQALLQGAPIRGGRGGFSAP